ncbi:nicotinic acid mononucleotide adenylyltransferase [Candidatus Desantisbacteria bacterium CG_4_10_14_0_8_um_filter_48_22]|uniref:Probable nicotinate-nucleotide adenylyltransferase n=1 Tax=Candidatus Desantisbacteria bacterium CG_4_10_14_0_8_um_filter_48_22 TaxID=1974543 RepID=A0A2M7SDV4_9BACT|nr:MAG: nicotinate (nicotinamide) nucleotide adenylyltransferase [Candidatus Desantisbacteria bacterium CG1_02_49_89]PIV54595.1 MAG: nicotinic acid mononucleotide adenylyltransferase [Candidatus Desantisbacteria bacterium CG02_land_8_20_14_3_00_49_13]PIZ17664.1 MAG: nicotinic acid mononucleotide adenylyltransferase [Candidatus Desantisbacteria bacterium CG_4_10_14_0_8_um_filter_48_22]
MHNKVKANKERKIGILGGTFNPVHNGHIKIAEAAQKKLGLEKVIFVPCARPPHKTGERLPPPADRYEMTRIAVKGSAAFSISDSEIRRKGKSYTIDTVRAFRKADPGSKYCFVIGADTLREIPAWREYRKLLKMCRFVVVNRPGYSIKDYSPRSTSGRNLVPTKSRADRSQIADLIKIKIPGIDISSTEIREKIKAGRSIKTLVPSCVEKYITKKGLYK